MDTAKPNRPKLLLVMPNLFWCEGDASTLWHFIPYNLCLLAAMVEDLCEVQVLDAYAENLTQEQLAEAVRKSAPDIVGVTVMMDQYAQAGHKTARIVKEVSRDILVLMGGVYPTVNTELAIRDENVDYVFIGEGEYTTRQFMEHYLGRGELPAKGIAFRRPDGSIDNRRHSDFIQDLDALPLPAYHLIDYHRYSGSADRKSVDSPPAYPYARVFTSRGCPVGCVFCQVESIQGKGFRGRSPENVLAELAWLKETYGVKSIIFDDDNMFTNRPRAIEFLQGMIDRGLDLPWVSIATAVFRLDDELVALMRRSGCQYICIAIESGSERVLKEVVKKPVNYDHAKKMVALARKHGIYVAANFIVGFPTETWDEIRQTIRFAEELGTDYVKIFHAIPLRHTRLWELCIETGSFRHGFDIANIRWSTGQIETPNFSPADLTILRAYEWERINFSTPEKCKRTAEMMDISEEKLLEIRRQTLLNAQRSVAHEYAEASTAKEA